jgi:uncharacterized protein
MSALPTPAPTVTAETAPFWRAAASGELLLPRCARCERFIWYPRDFCPHCGVGDVGWVPVTGRGRIYSVTVVRRAPHPNYANAVPYSVAVVELDEGIRLLTNIVSPDLDGLAIGQPVEAVFDPVDDFRAVVRFQPLVAGRAS